MDDKAANDQTTDDKATVERSDQPDPNPQDPAGGEQPTEESPDQVPGLVNPALTPPAVDPIPVPEVDPPTEAPVKPDTANPDTASPDIASPDTASPDTAMPTSEPLAQPVTPAAPPTDEAPPSQAPPSDKPTPDKPTPDDTSTQVAETPKPRRMLNPTVDPAQAKAVPSIPSSTPADQSATEPSDESAPAPEDAAQPQGEEPPPPPAAPVDVPPANDNIDADLEAEIEAAMSTGQLDPNAVVEAVAEAETANEEAAAPSAPAKSKSRKKQAPKELGEGSRISATVQSIHGDNVFLDVRDRSSGVVSLRQFPPKKPPSVGDQIDVIVEKLDDEEGLVICNLKRGSKKVSGDWNEVAVGQQVDCMVQKTNKGGLEVAVGSLRGFMPAGQVDMSYVEDLEPFVGQKLTARIIEVNPQRRKLILSRRQLLFEERAETEKEMLDTIEAGQTFTGRVKTLKNYGAFVDIGGIDGLVHVGQISWSRINHPSDVLKEGQNVDVKVISVDTEGKKISLSMRELQQNPWSNIEDNYPPGTVASGKVTRTADFGAFVELEPGVEGLIHISQLEHHRVKRVSEVVKEGQQVEASVLEVDPKRKRISLSLKALKEKPEAPTDADLAPSGGEAYERQRTEPLKGGTGDSGPGGLFGDPGKFS